MFTKALILILCLSISGVVAPLAAFADGEADKAPTKAGVKALHPIARRIRDKTIPIVLKLRNTLHEGQMSKPDLTKILEQSNVLFGELGEVNKDLMAAANELSPAVEADVNLLSIILTAYFSYTGLLRTTYEAFGYNLGTNGAFVEALDPVLPKGMAIAIAGTYGSKAEAAKLDTFEIPFELKPVKDNDKVFTITLNAREASRFRMGAFMAFPDAKTGTSALRFQALKLSFLRQALLNGYLNSDRKILGKLSASADPALQALQSQAYASAWEGAYRNYVTSTLLGKVSSRISAQRGDFAKALESFFDDLVMKLGDALDLDWIANQGGTKKVAQLFVDFEKGKRAEFIAMTLKNTSIYLTEISRADLQQALLETSLLAFQQSLTGVFGALLKPDVEVTFDQQEYFMGAISKLTEKAVSPTIINDDVLNEFEKTRNDGDAITTLRRYSMAVKVINGVNVLDAVEKNLEAVKNQKIVREDIITSGTGGSPDPAQVLLAMNDQKGMPAWAWDIMQGLATAAKNNKKSTYKASMTTSLSSLASMEKWLRDIKESGDRESIDEIVRIHKDKMQHSSYRWASLDRKLKIIGQRLQSDTAKRVLKYVLELNKLSTILQTPSFKGRVNDAFNALTGNAFNGDDLYSEVNTGFMDHVAEYTQKGIDYAKEQYKKKIKGMSEWDIRRASLLSLIEETEKAQTYLEEHKDFFTNVFAGKTIRDKYLKGILADPAVFTNYLGITVAEIQNSLPLLFTRIPLPTYLRPHGKTGLGDKPVAFHELVRQVRKALLAMSPGMVALGAKSETEITPSLIQDRSNYSKTFDAGISITDLIQTAMGSTDGGDGHNFFGTQIVKFADWWNDRKEPPSYDSDWPTEFKYRDVIPAKYDTAGASAFTKAERIVITALLDPYIRSAARGAEEEQKLLLDQSSDVEKLITQSQSFHMLMSEIGDEVGDGLEALAGRAVRWKRRWQALKEITTLTQEGSHYLFYATFLLPELGGHGKATLYMVLSMAFDLAADAGIFMDYAHTYSELGKFTQSGALGLGAIKMEEMEKLRQELHQMGEMLFDRGPMDLAFALSVLHGGFQSFRQWRGMKIQEKVLKRHGYDPKEFFNEMQQLSTMYYALGLHPLETTPEQFETAFQAAVAKKKAGDPLATQQMPFWGRAREMTQAFEKKYAKLTEDPNRPKEPKKKKSKKPKADKPKADKPDAKAEEKPAGEEKPKKERKTKRPKSRRKDKRLKRNKDRADRAAKEKEQAEGKDKPAADAPAEPSGDGNDDPNVN